MPIPSYFSTLGIPSPEGAEVQALLGAQQPQTRTPAQYADPVLQRGSDYYDRMTQRGIEYQQQQQALEAQAQAARLAMLPTANGQAVRSKVYQDALKQAVYQKQAKALLDDLSTLDPGDPDHLLHQDEVIGKHDIAQEALKDPRVAGMLKRQTMTHAEMQKLFDEDPQAVQDYADLKTSGVDPMTAQKQVRSDAQKRKVRIAFAKAGGDIEAFDSGAFDDPRGNPDEAKLSKAVYDLARRQKEKEVGLRMGNEEKAMVKAAVEEAYPGPSKEEKAAKFTEKNKRAPVTEDDWSEAYYLAAQPPDVIRQKRVEALRKVAMDLREQGFALPDELRKLIPDGNEQDADTNAQVRSLMDGTPAAPTPATQAAPQAAAPAASGDFKVTPSGAKFKRL